MSFIHIISTRFNVPTKVWTTTREGNKPLSDEWLADRFEIFEKYCFPSFKNQNNKDFVWLVFFDAQTPVSYLEKIENFSKKFSNFTPIFVNDFEEMNTKLLSTIPDFYTPESKFVISSDIDNDDMIHRDFVQNIQKQFKPVHNLVIELRRGLQLTKIRKNEGFANEFYEVANAFVSLVENISDVKTVIKEKHPNYRTYENKVWYDAKPMFIQFIHANNLVNNTIKSKRISEISFSDFGIHEENYFKISKLATKIHNWKRIPKLVYKILKSKISK